MSVSWNEERCRYEIDCHPAKKCDVCGEIPHPADRVRLSVNLKVGHWKQVFNAHFVADGNDLVDGGSYWGVEEDSRNVRTITLCKKCYKERYGDTYGTDIG